MIGKASQPQILPDKCSTRAEKIETMIRHHLRHIISCIIFKFLHNLCLPCASGHRSPPKQRNLRRTGPTTSIVLGLAVCNNFCACLVRSEEHTSELQSHV